MKYELRHVVLHALTQNDPNKEIFKKRLAPYLKKNSFLRAPINPLLFQDLNRKHGIVITKKVYDVIEVIDDYNYKNKKEVPFVLYGKQTDGGVIIFNDIDCDFDKLEDSYASFNNIEEYLFLKIRRFSIEKSRNKVICLGHTHPFHGDKTSFNYSFTDLVFHLIFLSYKIFQNPKYNNKVFSLMKSISKDFNFIYYDMKKGCFLKAPKVLLQKKKKEFIPLSAYQFCDD